MTMMRMMRLWLWHRRWNSVGVVVQAVAVVVAPALAAPPSRVAQGDLEEESVDEVPPILAKNPWH